MRMALVFASSSDRSCDEEAAHTATAMAIVDRKATTVRRKLR
jgi:hypothetical protein